LIFAVILPFFTFFIFDS